ncbi:MAG: NADPH-dependent FMN reductase [Alphaproteobacteria bacterium]
MMNFVIISGSHQAGSQSLKVSKWLSDYLVSKGYGADIIDLGGDPLPLWTSDAWKADSELATHISPYLQKVENADGLILVAPEWAGMAPAALKNFLLYIGSKHAAHKPAMIVGVSSGRGGTYPISELRMSGYKNNRLVYIPDHLIVQDVNQVMNDPDLENGSKADLYIKNRSAHSLDVLAAYAKAMTAMREGEEALIHKEYPFGM